MVSLDRILAFAILLTCSVSILACTTRSLRGWSEKSPGGRTYLVVIDPNGSNCPPIFIDGRAVSSGIGEMFEIEPGDHEITCGTESDKRQGIGFTVEKNTIFHFDYWGP